MKVSEFIQDESFHLLSTGNVESDIKGVYTGDLLSWVMHHAKIEDAWCTVLTHVNIIAVASLLQLACVIVCEDAPIEVETIEKAKKEKINLIKTNLSAVEVIRKFHD